MQWGKDKLFKNGTGKIGLCYEKTKLYPCLLAHTKIN